VEDWLDENAKARIMAGNEGKITFKFYYPGVITGMEHIVVTVNGSEQRVIPIDASTVTAEFDVAPSQVSEFTFESNFFYDAATEQRGEDRLSVVADITAN